MVEKAPALEIVAAEIRSLKLNAGQLLCPVIRRLVEQPGCFPARVGEDRAGDLGLYHAAAGKVGAAEVNTAEIRAIEYSVREVRSGRNGVLKVRAARIQTD